MRREAGWTLLELMAVLTVLTAAALAIGGVTEGIRREDRISAAYTRDVRGLRRALQTVEADLREAREMTGHTIDGIPYRLEGDRLLRNGHELAGNIAHFAIVRAGDRATVRIVLRRRSDQPSRREGVITSCVRLRALEVKR
ncbi:MAG: PulJ/GspJ family protein [Planctomycetota bacterium]|jgi:type II secretory pathway component PulJ